MIKLGDSLPCWTKNCSDVLVDAFCLVFVLHMCMELVGCDQGGRCKDCQGRDGANIMKDGTVDLQHGTEVEGDLHPCIKGHDPK